MKKNWLVLVAVMMTLVMAMAITACNKAEEKKESAEEPAQEEQVSTEPELTEEQLDALMKQVAEKELELEYTEVMPDEAFGAAKVFKYERDGDKGTAYVYMETMEFVALKDKAYNMSGGSGEAIITFTYGDEPKLENVEWSADGGEHEPWIKENFPKEYVEEVMKYEADDEAKVELSDKIEAQVKKTLGVPVESENMLEVDPEKGTYEITKGIDKEDGTFDVETIEKGELSDVIK